MNGNYFLVGTEYQLLLTIGIIQQYYEGDRNVVYRISPAPRKRLRNISLNVLNVELREIFYDYSNPTRNLKRLLDSIIEETPNNFFFFLENKFWLNYLLRNLKIRGTKIVLAPDGMKVYNDVRKPVIKYLYHTIEALIDTFKAHLIYDWPLVERVYATSKYIDEVWVQFPQHYHNRSGKKVVAFNVNITDEYKQSIKKVFNVDDDFGFISNSKSILFVDSPSSEERYLLRTREILEHFQEIYPDRCILIKQHPLASARSKEEYAQLKGVTFLAGEYPAELYICAACDAIVISMISTSLLFYNTNCQYYWIYPLYKGIFDYSHISNPTEYIRVINDLSKI